MLIRSKVIILTHDTFKVSFVCDVVDSQFRSLFMPDFDGLFFCLVARFSSSLRLINLCVWELRIIYRRILWSSVRIHSTSNIYIFIFNQLGSWRPLSLIDFISSRQRIPSFCIPVSSNYILHSVGIYCDSRLLKMHIITT